MIRQQISLSKKSGKKLLAVLIDPEKTAQLEQLLKYAQQYPPDIFLVGGSSENTPHLAEVIRKIKSIPGVPVVLFPGHPAQIDAQADGILLLSLISGRNADHLIGQHVKAAIPLKKTGLEILPTGYILVDGGRRSTTATFTNTEHISRENIDEIVSTALAGEQLGMHFIYLEAGSGAPEPVPVEIINRVRKETGIPLIVGGGIKNAEQMRARFDAGADIVVIGNILEQNPSLLLSFVTATPLLPL